MAQIDVIGMIRGLRGITYILGRINIKSCQRASPYASTSIWGGPIICGLGLKESKDWVEAYLVREGYDLDTLRKSR